MTAPGPVSTFQDVVATGERMPLKRALALLQAAALAVDAWHARQDVHGSLCPSSFRLDTEDRVTLQPPTTWPADRSVADLPRAYWSPQRQAGEPAGRADDLYALGLIAKALLAGPRPADGVSTTLTSSLPSEIEAVLQAQCSWALSQRFASGVEFARELSRAAARAGPSRDQTSLPGVPERRADHEPAWAAAHRVAQARASQRLTLAELPDRGLREHAQPMQTVYNPIRHRNYPRLPLTGGWVVALVVVLCSVYLFPLYFMLFPHG